VSLNSQLNNGDVVEIISSRENRGPSRDWLSPHLGYVKTSHARSKIRQWFKKQERTENIERGRQILEKELRHLGIKIDREELAALFSQSSVDDFLAAVGYGGITSNQIALKLAAQHETPREVAEVTLPKSIPSTVRVLGVGDLVTNLAQCCHPVPGDNIIGYVTRSRGVTIHRQDCLNVLHEDEKERLVPAEWGPTDSVYPVNVEVQAWDRMGLIRDITTVVAEEKVNINAVNFTKNRDQSTTGFITLEVKGLAQLSRLLVKIEGIRGIIGASRIGDEATMKASQSTKHK
jgi:GTP pyrophosphokinase